jgi:uncharacterized membrane protein YeaQ/YmgE (transglycosylase-associated protein family)
MALITWMIVGLLSGWLTSEIMRGRGASFLNDILFGIIGALAGGVLASALFDIQSISAINLVTLLAAFVGAMFIILLARALRGGHDVA